MKNIAKQLPLLFAFVLFAQAKPQPPGQKIEPCAFLDVTAEYDSLTVFLDDQPVGKTPLIGYAISTGAHELVVQSPNWPSWSQPNFRTDFVAMPGRSYRFRALFRHNVLVNSIPYGAKVYRDGVYLGETPLYVEWQDRGRLNIKKEGYHSVELKTFELSDSFILIRLEPLPSWVQARREKVERQKAGMQFRRRMLVASMGMAVAAGLATIHFRSRGNEEFGRYQTTAIPAKMDHYFGRAQYYDRLASLSYALFETGFVLSGYFFLTSRPFEWVE